jgi:hypothetical protein
LGGVSQSGQVKRKWQASSPGKVLNGGAEGVEGLLCAVRALERVEEQAKNLGLDFTSFDEGEKGHKRLWGDML